MQYNNKPDTFLITIFEADLDQGIPTTLVTEGARHSLTWDELVETLVTDPPIVNTADVSNVRDKRLQDAKFFGPALSFATFRDDYRKDEYTEAVCAAGLDLDYDDQAKVDEAIERAKTLSTAFMWYGSWKPGRARLVFPYERAISGDDHRKLYTKLSARLGIELDGTSINPSRLHFAPQVPSAERLATHRAGVFEGSRLLSLSTLESSAPGVSSSSAFAGVRLSSVRVGESKRAVSLDDLAVLSTSTEKHADLNRIAFGLAAQAGRAGEALDAFTARVWPTAEEALRSNTIKPVADWRDAQRCFETAAADGHAAGAKDRAETKATSEIQAASDKRQPNYEVLGSVTNLLKKGSLSTTYRILGSHGFTGLGALAALEVVVADLDMDPASFVERVDQAAREHEGPPIPHNDFDNCRYMSDLNAIAPRWLCCPTKKNPWHSLASNGAGYVETSASTAWSESCQLARRPELRRQVDEPTLLSAAFRDSFVCEYESTLIDQAEPLMFDAARRTLVENTARLRPLKPKRSERFEKYQRLVYPSDQVHALTLWLAGCADLSLQLPMIILYSTSNVGKTVFAKAVSRLHGTGGCATDAALMGVDNWSDEYLRMPWILADEAVAKPVTARYIDVNKLKTNALAAERTIRERNQNNIKSLGYIRMFITINEPAQLCLPPSLVGDVSTIKSLGQRTLVLTPRHLTSEELAPFMGMFEGDEIAQHCLWLYAQHGAELHERQRTAGTNRACGLANGEPWFQAWAQSAATDGFTSDAVLRMMSEPSNTQLCGKSHFDPKTGNYYALAIDVAKARGSKVPTHVVFQDLKNLAGEPERAQRKIGSTKHRGQWFRITRELQKQMGFVSQGDEDASQPAQQSSN